MSLSHTLQALLELYELEIHDLRAQGGRLVIHRQPYHHCTLIYSPVTDFHVLTKQKSCEPTQALSVAQEIAQCAHVCQLLNRALVREDEAQH